MVHPSSIPILAGLNFLSQEIATAEPLPIHRSERRRAQKANLPEPSVKRVMLRRKQHTEHGPNGEGKEFSCQWIVRSHWRRNWRNPSKPSYVHSYVKGDPSKPLKQPTQTIYHVSR